MGAVQQIRLLIKKQSNLLDPYNITAKASSYVGIDEVGRGPLAGPVYAAAVVLNDDSRWETMRDSKVLSPERREALAVDIKEHAIAWSIASCNVAEIDQWNIFYATLVAMQRAYEAIKVKVDMALVDGKYAPLLAVPAYSVIKGDRYVNAISAASIIAKVARDAYMQTLHDDFPMYGFAQHKGYPTAQHLAALNECGPCCHHRHSFRPVFVAKEKMLNAIS